MLFRLTGAPAPGQTVRIEADHEALTVLNAALQLALGVKRAASFRAPLEAGGEFTVQLVDVSTDSDPRKVDARATTPWGLWVEACRERGRPAPFALGPDTSASKALWKACPDSTKIRALFDAYLDDTNAWLKDRGHPLRSLLPAAGKYQALVEKKLASQPLADSAGMEDCRPTGAQSNGDGERRLSRLGRAVPGPPQGSSRPASPAGAAPAGAATNAGEFGPPT
jgi:hypothetical protein